MKKSYIRYAEVYARNMVNDFVNHPEYRGPTFTFEQLPDMISGLARCSAFMSFPRVKSCDEEKIGEYAKHCAVKILKEKNLL